jgi:flagellar hook-basal body complex protein FliE
VNRVNGDSMKVSGDNTVPDFQTMFKTAIDNVNENQKVAGNLATRFEQGDASIDLPEVMIALQKSSVSFQAMTQVRNKLVEAYKDIMNMPV